MQNSKPKYTLKEKLDIAESISTVLMFLMAVWGTVAAYDIVNHYHSEIVRIEYSEQTKTAEHKTPPPENIKSEDKHRKN